MYAIKKKIGNVDTNTEIKKGEEGWPQRHNRNIHFIKYKKKTNSVVRWRQQFQNIRSKSRCDKG